MANENRAISHRNFSGLAVSTRSDGDDGKVVTGHAAVFSAIYDVGYFRERFMPGAFSEALARGDDVRALIEHDPGRIIGRTKSGTLRLSEDERGLAVSIDLPDTQEARDLAVQISRGDKDQMSIGFRAIVDEWDETDPDSPLRTVSKASLLDVSMVTFAASEVTSAQVRALETELDAHRKQMNFANANRRLRMKAGLDHRERGLRERS